MALILFFLFRYTLYNLEIHIIFDNVFDEKDGDGKKSLNRWVSQFCEILWTKVEALDAENKDDKTKAATNFKDLMNPKIVPTPYGGRIVIRHLPLVRPHAP